MSRSQLLFWFVILITVVALLIDLPGSPLTDLEISLGPLKIDRRLELRKGLDLQGGLHLTLAADMSGIAEEDQEQALESARNIISRRVDLYGVNEPVIQTARARGQAKIYVDLPGLKNVDQAVNLIGQTARLEFKELEEDKKASPSAATLTDFKATGLGGQDLKKAQVQFDPQTGQPVVGLVFSAQGAEKFKELTQRNVGAPLAIFLDDLPVTAPQVNEPILTGEAVISGQFTVKQAENLAIQLNAGALPVPIEIVEQKTVGASLGQDSVRKSVQAGAVGLLMVILFMIVVYGFLGLLADLGLIIYGLITLALYKLIPVTLTLPGLAGFILSVGMAVDSNILIFERIKEERWLGKPKKIAMELGFGRAWDSIKDANVCTLITCFVLFNPFNWGFLNTSGMIRGFALTLALGIGVSLFTGIVVTRTLIRVFYKG